MNEFSLKEIVEKLESIFVNILYLKPEERLVNPNLYHLSDIKSSLNNIFPDAECTDVLYTNNIDKQFFGVKINPVMSAQDAIFVLTTDERFKFTKYQLELDSKLFDIDMTADEIVAIILFEISSMIDNYEITDQVRSLIDLYVLSNDDIISIRDSVNYTQLIIYALKDTYYKASSIMFKEDLEEITCNRLIQTLENEDSLISGQNKIISSSYGVGDTVRSPKVIILQWMFMVYKDMDHNSNIIKDTLNDAKDFTGSRLDKMEIDKTLVAIDRISTQAFTESGSINKVLESKAMYSVCEVSLFKSLKQNGLRGIENDLYEYTIRIKNCETEEDAMYILRCINTRLSIIEDYLYNTPDLSETERKHWEEVATAYRELRIQMSKKKIWNKQRYGLFMDYNYLDSLDNNNDEY